MFNNKIKGGLILVILLFITISAVNATEVVSNDTTTTGIDTLTTQHTQEMTETTSNQINDNIIQKNNNNNIKESTKTSPSESKDYYISDTEGSDTNEGTQSSPFKTIQTALDKTDNQHTYNIYIDEGIYKGLGNTNLTISGDQYINFIGSGINKTVFDGEANYTLGEGGSVWGGTAFWNEWYNTSGNWIMNITPGNGFINIHDMTIQNSWHDSGSSVATSINATINNYGTLNVTNVYFHSNHAGSGAGLRNDGTLYVDNCTFENNTKASTTGNMGAAIFNNGTAIVKNSNIVRNYARWGSVTNDKNITLINCTFEGNYAYDTVSEYKNGPSFATDTGIFDFYHKYGVTNITSSIINCTFKDNEQCDISNGGGELLVENCLFNHSTGIYLFGNPQLPRINDPTQVIRNNTFEDMQPTTIFKTMSNSKEPSLAIHSKTRYNLTIEDNNINIGDNKDNSYSLYLGNNAQVINNNITDCIYSGKDNNIVNNTIKTNKEFTIALPENENGITDNTKVINNTLYAGFTYGDLSIRNVKTSNLLENNKPETNTYIIDNNNYTTYFDDQSVLKTDIISNGSKIILTNELTNKKFIFDNVNVLVDVNTTLYNTTITTRNNARIQFNNLKIDNTNTEEDYVILLGSEKNIIKDADIKVVMDKPAHIIKIEEDGNIITGSIINATLPADEPVNNITQTVGIAIRSSHNLLNNTSIYVDSMTPTPLPGYSEVNGVLIQSKTIDEYATGNKIIKSKINVTGAFYAFALKLVMVNETVTSLTDFIVQNEHEGVGIGLNASDNNNLSGNIIIKSDDAYGCKIDCQDNIRIINNTILSKLNLEKIEAEYVRGIYIYGASNIKITDAEYKLYGKTFVRAMHITKNDDDNPENIYINNLNIIMDSSPTASSTMIYLKNGNNVTIDHNTITSVCGTGINLVTTTNSSVTNNYLNVGNTTGGNEAVKDKTKKNIIYNNTPIIGLLTDDTYSNYFDENCTLYADVDIIRLGGDLHDKVLNFNSNKTTDIINAKDYTMYNTTVKISGILSSNPGKTPTFTFDNINFNNTNKSVFIDESESTVYSKDINFINSNITVTGDDIIAFDAWNDNSQNELKIDNCNIIMDGENVDVIKFAGYQQTSTIKITNNNITLNANNKAGVLNSKTSEVDFRNNNITITADDVIVTDMLNTRIASSGFKQNNITAKAKNATAIKLNTTDFVSGRYFSENIIKIKTENPSTLIDITHPNRIDVKDNEIILDTENGERPVVSVTGPSSSVKDNYILANDVCGDDAVAQTGITISNNKPMKVEITTEDKNWTRNKESTLSFNITDKNGENVTGEVNVTVNDVEVPVNDNTVTYTPTTLDDVNVVISYTDPNKEYMNSNKTVTISVNNPKAVIEAVVNSEITVNKTTPIFIVLKDEDANIITGQKVNVIVAGESETINLKDGFAIYQYTPDTVGQVSMDLIFEETENYEETTETLILNVSADKDAIIEELNNTVNEQSNTIDTLNNTIEEQAGTISDLNNTIQEQTSTINTLNDTVNNLNNTVQEQANTIDTLNNTIEEQAGTISDLNNTIQEQTGTITTLNDTVNDLNSTVQEQAGTITDLNNTVSQQNATINDLQEQIDELKAPKNTTLTLDEITDAKYNGEVIISGTLVNDDSIGLFNQEITLTIGDEEVTVKTKGGVFEYTTVFKELGEKTVTAKYAGNDKYLESEANMTFTIEKQDLIITYDAIKDIAYDDNVTITGKFTDANGKAISNSNVNVYINGKQYKARTDKTGAFTLSAQVKTVGTNNVTLSYGGNAYYNSYETTTTFNTDKQDLIITYDTITDIKYGDNVTITGKFTDKNGKAITNSNVNIYINGKQYKARTDKTGAFTLSVQVKALGTSNVTFSYGGNAKYNSYETSTTFNVEKQDLLITCDPIQETVCGDNVTITGKFTDANGKAISKSNVNVYINGKQYKAKTDTNGVFTLSVATTLVGTNNVTLSYGGNTYYNSYETNTTFTVIAKAN